MIQALTNPKTIAAMFAVGSTLTLVFGAFFKSNLSKKQRKSKKS